MNSQPLICYPSYFSALDQLQIDQALLAHNVPPLNDPLPALRLHRGQYASEPVALQAVLEVFEVIVQVLCYHVEYQPAPTLRADADRSLGEVIAWLEPCRPVGSSLNGFTATVRAARDTCAWWLTFREITTPLIVTTTVPKSRPRKTRDVSRLQAERERVVVPLLDEVGWTATKWALESRVDPSVTLDYLAGKSTPRRVQMTRIRNTLAIALKQQDTLRLPK